MSSGASPLQWAHGAADDGLSVPSPISSIARASCTARERSSRGCRIGSCAFRPTRLGRALERRAAALVRLGVNPATRGDVVLEPQPHLEAYFAVPAMGAVVHNLKLRLHPSELGTSRSPRGQGIIVDRDACCAVREVRAERALAGAHHRRRRGGAPGFPSTRSCRRRGRRLRVADARRGQGGDDLLHLRHHGNPKGVVYSHRSTVRTTMAACMTDSLNPRERTVLPVVPMFHAAAWGMRTPGC